MSYYLKDFREKMGYTQQDIANFLGVERSTYTCYETGKTRIPIIKLERLSKLYNVSLDAFLGGGELLLHDPSGIRSGKTEVGKLTKEEKSILAKIRLINAAGKNEELQELLDKLCEDV